MKKKKSPRNLNKFTDISINQSKTFFKKYVYMFFLFPPLLTHTYTHTHTPTHRRRIRIFVVSTTYSTIVKNSYQIWHLIIKRVRKHWKAHNFSTKPTFCVCLSKDLFWRWGKGVSRGWWRNQFGYFIWSPAPDNTELPLYEITSSWPNLFNNTNDTILVCAWTAKGFTNWDQHRNDIYHLYRSLNKFDTKFIRYFA